MKPILSILLFFSMNLQAQDIFDYYHQIYQADLLAKEGKLDSAILQCEKTFTKLDYTQSVLIYKVLNWSRAVGDKERIKRYKKQYKSMKKLPAENKDLYETIDSILEVDQRFMHSKYYKAKRYYENCLASNSCDTNSSKFRKARIMRNEKIAAMNKNVATHLKLIEEYGYIGEEMLGWKRSFYFLVPLLHYDTDTNSRVLEPVFREALLQNKIIPIVYTTIIDRHNFYTTGKQKYWTSPYGDLGEIRPNISKEEKKEILKLRENIGIYGSDFWFEYLHEEWVLKCRFSL